LDPRREDVNLERINKGDLGYMVFLDEPRV